MPTNETVTISALTYGPDAIAHRADGKAVFIPGCAPGDVVRVEYEEEKTSFARAHVVELIEAGPSRAEDNASLLALGPAAPWAHVSYSAQLAAKRENAVEALVRIGKYERAAAEALVGECVPSAEHVHYRNKIELACTNDASGRMVVGLTLPTTKEVKPIGHFALAHHAIADAPQKIQGALRYLEGGQPGRLGIFRIGIRHSARTGSCEIALWTNPGPFPRKEVARTLRDALPTTSIVRVIADTGRARKVKGVEALSGEGNWREKLLGFNFHASAPSFFQVNTQQAETLVKTVVEGLDIQEGMRVADLYCGVGTFTLPLANLGCDVSAVESAGSAVRDLRRNVEEAQLFVDVIGGDSARELPDLGALDALVVDPPRAGLAEGVAESIAAAAPKNVAYVSCDPATWARDMARMAACGYTLQHATPVDLFPQTYHVECVVLMSRKDT